MDAPSKGPSSSNPLDEPFSDDDNSDNLHPADSDSDSDSDDDEDDEGGAATFLTNVEEEEEDDGYSSSSTSSSSTSSSSSSSSAVGDMSSKTQSGTKKSKSRKPAWFDPDDANVQVSLADDKRLRKLRRGEEDDLVNGKDLETRLRTQSVTSRPNRHASRRS